MVLILGINGSPKRNPERSNTNSLLQLALEAAAEVEEVETHILHLSRLNILECDGCEVCTTKPCPLDKKDDFLQVEEQLLEAHGFIMASPTHWAGPSAIFTNFMSRSRDLKMPKSLLADKVAGFVTVSGLRVGGQTATVDTLSRFCLSHGMIVAGGLGHPHYNAPFAFGTIQYDLIDENEKPKVKFRHVKRDPISTADAKLLGRRIGELTKKIHQ